MPEVDDAAAVVKTTETYYDSDEADRFYFHVWGGEDIHIGLYEEGEAIREASARTVTRMADRLGELTPETRVLDLGAGYGGSARALAKRFGCRVTCLNLSETQNRRNRDLSAAQGLSDRIEIVHGNFEQLPFEAETYDVVWSQDAFLHSGKREQVLREARRVLKVGGQMVFTDPMQADDCPEGVLGPVLARIHLASMASFGFYREAARRVGLEEVDVGDLTPMLPRHYEAVRNELTSRYDEMVGISGQGYVDRMIEGLGHWIDAGRAGHLAWGILHFRAV